MSVEEIIDLCKRNDIRGKELMYKSFYGYIKAVLRRYIFTDHDVEELVNDSFVKIFSNLQGFRSSDKQDSTERLFRGWIGKIASRTAIDHLRKNKKNLFIEKIEDCHEVYSPVAVQGDLDAEHIFLLINQLPQMQKLVFNLYEIEGFKHDEIAQQLSISESSSRVYLVRAKNKLKDLYLNNQYNMMNK